MAVDLDSSPRGAKTLAVSATPALRLLTPAGRLVASHDGFLPADKLIAWLKEHFEAAAVVASDDLTGTEARRCGGRAAPGRRAEET